MNTTSVLDRSKPFFQLMRDEPRRPLMILMLCMLCVSLAEGFGVSLLAPMLALFQSAGQAGNATPEASYLAQWFRSAGIPFQGWSVLLLFVTLQLLKVLAQLFREIIATEIQCNLVDRLRERCFQAVLKSEWTWLSQRNNAEYANLLLTDVNRIGFGANFFIQLSMIAAQLLVYSCAALFLSPRMTLLVLAAGLFFFFTEGRLRREALQLGTGLGQTSQRLHSTVQESLQGMKLVKILGNEERHLHGFLESMRSYRRHMMQFQRSSSFSRARMQAGGAILLVVLLYAGLEQWHLPIAELAALIFVFSRLMPLGSQFQHYLHQWLHTLPALENTRQLLHNCAQVAEPEAKGVPPVFELSMVLRNLSFHYPERERAAVQQVNLTILPNTTTAIIGESGAGKSTLADLLMGLLRPVDGSILIDGTPLDDATRLLWRRSLAYVPQEPILFNDTIRANLQWAAPEAEDQHLWQALEQAAAGFVRNLPQGLDTLVGDHGLRLSGGERQRIALARALLRHPAILILDEATSALDMENEERIRQAIVNLHGNLTVVAIGHRMATLKHADLVVVMEQGCIRECGTWEDIQKNQIAH